MARQYKVFSNAKRNVPELNRVWSEVLHMTADIAATDIVKRMPKKKAERVAASTIRNLRNGNTIYPTLRTAFIIARAMGKQMTFTDEVIEVGPSKPIQAPKKFVPGEPIKLTFKSTAPNKTSISKVSKAA